MSKNYVLLLGAGFSKNWNGWLAEEVFEFLLSRPDVSKDLELRKTLWSLADGGFEAALEQIQRDAEADPTSELKRTQLHALQTAVVDMFTEMNNGFFQNLEFEFHNNREGTVREFLTRFHAIFTLNQDLLLEHHYKDRFDVSLEAGRRWDSIQIPGMKRLCVEDPSFGNSWAQSRWQPLPDAQYAIEPRHQPYFKLHGSSNWIDSKDSRLLVIGGGKEQKIGQHKILSRYAMEFHDRLRLPNTRLMIIGYGFKDHHINRAIADAVYKTGLRFFVIAPRWREVAKPTSSGIHPGIPLIVNGYDLEDVFVHGCIGGSSRPLQQTFREDAAELRKLSQFVEPW